MKTIIVKLSILMLAFLAVLGGNAESLRVIAINFNSGSGVVSVGSDSDIPDLPLDGAAWNNLSDASATEVAVAAKKTDGSEADGSASITYSSSGNYHWTDASTGVLKGYLDDNGANVNITLSNVPFAWYDVFVLAATDTENANFNSKTINGTAYTVKNGETVAGTEAWGASRNLTPNEEKNLMKVENLTSSTLSIVSVKNGSTTRGCIAALVLVEKDAPIVTKKMTSCFHLDANADNAVEGGPALTKIGEGTELWNTDTGKQAFGSAAFKSNTTTDSFVLEDFEYGLAPKTGWTLSFWVCPNGMASWTDVCGFAFGSVRYKIERNNGNAFQLYNNTGDETNYPALDNAIAYTDNNNSWVNLVFVSNANNDGFDIYANGTLVQNYMAKGTNKTFGNGLPTLTRVAIGVNGIGDGANTNNGRTSPALVDEVAIYNFAATAAQVKWLAANAPSEEMYSGDYAVEISGTVNVSTLAGKTATLVGDAMLLVDGTMLGSVAVVGAADKTLTLTDGPDYVMTAEDYAKIDLSSFKGQVVWDSAYVSGKACWIDYEFNGDMTSTGTDTSALNRDQDGEQYLYGPNLIDDFAKDSDNNAYGLYAGAHPYRAVSGYPNVWTCAIYGTLPEYNDGILVAFGTKSKGFVGLATQDVVQNKVRLVYVNGSGTILKEAQMSVPEAFTTPHLYLFTRDGNTITVYLDGKKIAELTNDDGYTFGNGLQIASVYEGMPSCLKRFAPNVFEDGVDDPRAKRCVLDAMRLYNVRLAQKAIDALKAEFPYESQIGKFTRTLSGGEANWVATDGWTSGTTTSAQPVADAEVVVTTGSAATTVAVNLNETANYSAVTFTGSAPVTLTAGSVPITAAETTIAAPVTIAYGAYNVSALTIAEGGSLVFDYSAYPIASVTAPVTIALTGLTQNYGESVSVTKPAEMAGRSMTFVYDTATRSYQLVLALTRPAGDIMLPADGGTASQVTLMNDTVYTDAKGEPTIVFYPEDWIVVDREVTVTIGQNLTIPAKLKVVAGGILKLNFASDVTQSGFAYNATVRVEEGGVYDLANALGHKDYSHPIILAGGTLTNTGVASDVSGRQYWQNTVEATSTIHVPENEFGAVNNRHEYHDYNLNGNTLVKTGAGQFTFRKAIFVGGGTLKVDEGTVVLDTCTVPEGAALNYVIAEGAKIEIVGNALRKTGMVTGAGTLVYNLGFTTSDVYQNAGWSGTVWIKNTAWDNANLGRLGNASTGAAYKLTGMTARPDNDGCNAPMILEDDGEVKALTISTNVTGAASYHFNTVSGSGTFQWNPALIEGDIPGRIFWLKNIDDYTGKLVTGNYLQFTIGGTSAGDLTPGAIKVADGVTLTPANWSAKSIDFGSTLKVKGVKGDVIATVTEAPSFGKVKVTLVDGETETTGYILKARQVTSGYKVFVSQAGFTISVR